MECPLKSVEELIDHDNRCWNKEVIDRFFHPTDRAAIYKIQLSYFNIEDRQIWGVSKHGDFSIKSAYHHLSDLKAANQRVAASSSKARPWEETPKERRIPVDSMCPRCGQAEETNEHILLTCPFARRVWFGSVLSHRVSDGEEIQLHQWIKEWSAFTSQGKRAVGETRTLISFILWHLWNARNDLLFSRKTWTAEEVIGRAHMARGEFLNASKNLSSPSYVAGLATPVHWAPPPVGTFALSCDASLSEDGGRSGVGYLIWDHTGTCRIAISDPQCFSKALVGEALAIRQGLLEAISEGFLKLRVESDCQTLVSAIRKPITSSHLSIRPIVEDIHFLVSYFDDCTFQFIPRAANTIADALPRRARSVAGRTV
ncbi:uncharacterized protein LOC122647964 [Telopea speciosissima]|uniref:uncharacterized protein LOC122647964 n=1 Tax=Telopea speciosissima TaxID=54955 RepID=UPI001CC72EDE|nr:uncharacterized protein LOC122647964 [Telopea speciosissima]